MKKLLWLDDYRNPWDKEIDWLVFSPIGRNIKIIWVKSYFEFIEYIQNNGLPTGICFDHDLGFTNEYYTENGINSPEPEKTGYDCAKWLVNYCLDNDYKLPLWNVQSANPIGKININSVLNGYKKYTGK